MNKKIINIIFLLFAFNLFSCKNNAFPSNSSLVISSNLESSIVSKDSSYSSLNSFSSSNSSSSSINKKDETSSSFVTKKYKVFLNPSVQYNNLYFNSNKSEGYYMNEIAKKMILHLKDVPYIDLYYNTSSLSLSKSCLLSNSLGIDYHIALHSNAGGGSGLETYSLNKSSFTKAMHKGLLELGNFKDRGIKNGSHLYELKNVKAKEKVLLEILFHDDEYESKFIVSSLDFISEKLASTLINYLKNKS